MTSFDLPAAPSLFDLLRDPDPDGLQALLAQDVRFRSPFADYHGRADVAHLVGLIARVLRDLEPRRSLEQGTTRLTVLVGTVGEGEPIQGVLSEERDEGGELVDAMLTIRPYSALRLAMGAMRELLDESPLPGARA